MVTPLVRRKNIGGKATFTCESKNPVTWYFEPHGESHPMHEPVSWRNTIKRLMLLSRDSGTYYCLTQSPGTHFNVMGEGRLYVYGKMAIFTYSTSSSLHTYVPIDS